MKKIITLLMLITVVVYSQSNHTVTFTGNASDFNTAEKYSAALNNTDYYTTFDASYLYIGAFRTSGTFGDYDHFTVYVDSDPQTTLTAGTGSTTGVNWDSNTPTLPFTANYRIVIRPVNSGESFYSSYSGGVWSTGGTNSMGWTKSASTTALELRIPWTDLGSPSQAYLTNYMSYNGGFFSPAPGSVSGSTISGYFGGFKIQSGITPNAVTNSPYPYSIDGIRNIGEGYTLIGSMNTNNSFASDKASKIWVSSTATDVYFFIESQLGNNNNNVVVFLNFNDYTGTAASTTLGSGGAGVFNTMASDKMDFEVDYAFAFNAGNTTTTCYLDRARFYVAGIGAVGTGYVGSCNQSGTTNTANNYVLAFNNGGGSDQGFEVKIPFTELPGVTNTSMLSNTFVIISQADGFYSNESIPENTAKGASLGYDYDFSNAGDAFDYFSSPSFLLPVELTSFSALIKNKSVNLLWHTATEVNNYGFEIEKRQSSTANSQWSKIGFVNGNGNSNSANDYSYTDKTVTSGKYTYRLKQIDNDGQYEYSKEVEVDLGKPTTFALNQNYPNPFNPSTSIQYSVVGSQYVSLKVFNVLGKEVAVLVNEKQEPGTYTVDFTSANLSGGAYFYRLQAGDFVQTKKMILLK